MDYGGSRRGVANGADGVDGLTRRNEATEAILGPKVLLRLFVARSVHSVSPVGYTVMKFRVIGRLKRGAA